MSDHAVEHGHAAAAHHVAAEAHHPGAMQYLVIAAVLTILTVLEIGVYYVQALQPVLVPLLIILAICKFVLVAMYYMHLHFDSRVFSVLFIFPLMLAVFILFSLIMLLTYLAHHPG
jgi:cytochrome c oxidase subunit IV